MNGNEKFKTLLKKSAQAHGHLCPGQVIGVRMGILGASLLGYDVPFDDSAIKNVVIFVEIDRCAADALTTVTGVKLGRRSLKFKDYGLMAATFLRLSDNKAFRVSVKDSARETAAAKAPELKNKMERELEVYQILRATELFTVEEVSVSVKPEDLPGWSGAKEYCSSCKTVIRHKRGLVKDGALLCRVCADAAYFKSIQPIAEFEDFDPNQVTTLEDATDG